MHDTRRIWRRGAVRAPSSTSMPTRLWHLHTLISLSLVWGTSGSAARIRQSVRPSFVDVGGLRAVSADLDHRVSLLEIRLLRRMPGLRKEPAEGWIPLYCHCCAATQRLCRDCQTHRPACRRRRDSLDCLAFGWRDELLVALDAGSVRAQRSGMAAPGLKLEPDAGLSARCMLRLFLGSIVQASWRAMSTEDDNPSGRLVPRGRKAPAKPTPYMGSLLRLLRAWMSLYSFLFRGIRRRGPSWATASLLSFL